jgi:hypothetical protein
VLSRLRRVTDLFVKGKEVRLPDGSYLYVRALNSFERAEALSAAQSAKARFAMALEDGGEELDKIRARLVEVGREEFCTQLASARALQGSGKFIAAIEADAEWAERLEILRRSDAGDDATPLTPEEIALIAKIGSDFVAEAQRRQDDEQAFQIKTLEGATDDDLVDEYKKTWLEQRGNAIANAEYRLTEVWYSARLCAALATALPGEPAGVLDHGACGGHAERLFDSRAEVREAPDDLVDLLSGALAEIDMAVADPKDSARPASSSDSSAPPSSPGEGADSGSAGTPEIVPGI